MHWIAKRAFNFRILLAILVLANPAGLYAGSGKAFNTLVVVNTNSADSVELGNYYASAHGIPAHHICRISITTNTANLETNEFRAWLLNPITNHIATNDLTGQIDYLILCHDIPTRVRHTEGVSASLFYGFKNAPSYWEAGGCNLPSYTSNAYYKAERSFHSADGWNSTNGFIAFHLIASNLATAKLVVDRGADAQSTFPCSTINLHMNGEIGRFGREARYANAQFSFSSLPGLPVSCILAPYRLNMFGITNVMGFHDGFSTIPYCVRMSNTWMNGAYADHLTSWGGYITGFTNGMGQSTVLDWMGIGATASYGTITEPCAYLEKFPDPVMSFYYARGFTIGEAYTMSVEAPYHGLFAGDPLSAPFAAPPSLAITSPESYQIVTGSVPVHISACAHSNGVPPATLDLYFQDRLYTNLVALGPMPGNTLTIAVDGITNSAVAGTNDTLFNVVAALANAINSNSSQLVVAKPYGDRIELAYKYFDHAGDNAPVFASASSGTATSLTLGVGLAATNLHPSTYSARKRIWLYSATSSGANAGDTLTCTLTLTNGVSITNHLVASQGEKITNLLERLMLSINTNSTLMATNGVLYDRLANGVENVWRDGTLFARTPGPDGWGIQIDYQVTAVSNGSGLVTNYNFSSFMDDNPGDIRPRASVLFHVRPTNGVLQSTWMLDTTAFEDGIHVLDVVARDGSAAASASRLSLPMVICNESPQLTVLGTNGMAITNGEPASLAKGTDFGRNAIGIPRTNVFAIRNNGSAPLAITNWATNGAGSNAFILSGIPASVDAGGISNFVVVFMPDALGLREASLSFESDAILPQTNIMLSGTGSSLHTLTVVSEHGESVPPVGIHTNWLNDVLSNSVALPAPAGGTQYVCTGWSMAGHTPLAGYTTNFQMTVTNNATLIWLWTTNYWLETSSGPNGTVDVASAWQPAGIATQITASANLYFIFGNWSGSVSETNNPLLLLMDAPQSIQANFSALLATNGTPQWWLAQYGWTNDFDSAATNDYDNDGFFTWEEYIADTHPTNPESFYLPLEATGSVTSLAFGIGPTSTGRHYYVDSTPLLAEPDWATITNSPGNGAKWLPVITPPGTGLYFYRSRVSLPP